MLLLPCWLTSKSFAIQLVILVLVLGPVGFTGGYLPGPSLGADPLVGGAFGLVTASVPMSLLVMQRNV